MSKSSRIFWNFVVYVISSLQAFSGIEWGKEHTDFLETIDRYNYVNERLFIDQGVQRAKRELLRARYVKRTRDQISLTYKGLFKLHALHA